jgi:ABC-type transport system substrate-binding protein
VKTLVSNIKTLNDYTMRITLNRPAYNFVDSLSPIDGDTKVIPRHFFKQRGSAAYAQSGLGSGPWIFQSRQIGQFVRFRANTNYWNKAGIPKFQFLRIVFVPDSTTCLNRLRAGDVDMCALGLDQTAAAQSSGIRIAGAKNVASHSVVFPLSDDPNSWTNKRAFRQALSLAINQPAIIRRFYPPSIGETQDNQTAVLFSASTRGYDPELPKYKYDPAEARRLLRSINYDGTPVVLWSYVLGAATELPTINEVVAQMWTSVGVKVNIMPLDFGSFFSRLTANPINLDHNVAHAAIVTPRTRPGVLGNITTWMLRKTDGGVTGIYWRPAFIAQQYKVLSAIKDADKLEAALKKLNNTLRPEFWAIPINLRNQTWGLSTKIQSWQPVKGNPSELNLPSLTPR